ncbi:MAG: polyribonucleotide nucleotidyltransferase [Bacteriovoracia bacterium]
MFNITSVSREFGGRKLTIETGKMARQADGAVVVTYGETIVLVTVCTASQPKEGIDFLPLTIEFQEKFYAAGRIPGGFFKREAKPSSDATLTARMIDRPIRPLFPEGYHNEIQVVATVLSDDKQNDPDVAASIGASAALSISSAPFRGPTAACRVGRVDGTLICNPNAEQMEKSDIDVFVAGTKKAIMMVEGGAKVVPEEDVLAAVLFGHQQMQTIIEMIDELQKKVGKEKQKVEAKQTPADFIKQAEELMLPIVQQALNTQDKQERYSLYDKAESVASEKLINPEAEDASEKEKLLSTTLENLKYARMREMILTAKKRIDGRALVDIRPISTEVGFLPRVHGSALFTRGETQVLGAVTLGTADDQQMIDVMRGTSYKSFMLNYNFPPFSVGEVGRMGTPGRREIGHGALAERAIANVMPGEDKCPYTVRVVCETLESNGSSSMGSVCATSMALMNAGIEFPEPVAGIAMGLIKEGDRVAVLSDILGDEDHLGDMDFKVAGTKEGVTAIQMDIKIEGVDEPIMRTALKQAKDGRLHILSKMAESITSPKQTVSDFAPRFTTMKIKPDKIREVIGSGGKVIKGIIEQTGVKIDVSDDGTIKIASSDPASAKKAEDIIAGIVEEPEVGKVYNGKVKSIVEFGAFVEILPGTDGLLHVSEIAHQRVNNVRDFVKEGEALEVKVIEVDERSGKVRLSRKVLLPRPEGMPPADEGSDRGPRGGDRGGRGGGRGDFRGGRGGRGDRGGKPSHQSSESTAPDNLEA